ncbi:transposase [Nonomuraea sp. MG754425]|uniref:transposase n=1 Tax=Nonomuraea sp. MG754425 TaxID=2570319 RepID=UPI0023518964|nr:transposase [Nonomuraea sp. MG754425]
MTCSPPSGGRCQQRRATFTGLCGACPLRDRCTTATTGRMRTIRPHHDLRASARRQAGTDPAWQADHRRSRPMGERAVAWLVAHGNRRPRDRRQRPLAPPPRRRSQPPPLVNLGLTHTNGTRTLTPIAP